MNEFGGSFTMLLKKIGPGFILVQVAGTLITVVLAFLKFYNILGVSWIVALIPFFLPVIWLFLSILIEFISNDEGA